MLSNHAADIVPSSFKKRSIVITKFYDLHTTVIKVNIETKVVTISGKIQYIVLSILKKNKLLIQFDSGPFHVK